MCHCFTTRINSTSCRLARTGRDMQILRSAVNTTLNSKSENQADANSPSAPPLAIRHDNRHIDRKLLFSHRTEARQGNVVSQGGDGGFRSAAAALNPPSPLDRLWAFGSRLGELDDVSRFGQIRGEFPAPAHRPRADRGREKGKGIRRWTRRWLRPRTSTPGAPGRPSRCPGRGREGPRPAGPEPRRDTTAHSAAGSSRSRPPTIAGLVPAARGTRRPSSDRRTQDRPAGRSRITLSFT